MTSKKKSTRNRNTAGFLSAHQTPSVEALVPEIRSDLKWKPTPGSVPPFTVPGTATPIIAAWNYGVPFKDMDKVHGWLRLNETALSGLLKSEMAAKPAADPHRVFYLGTYLNINGGTPMYQTLWGYTSEEALDTEAAWPNPIPAQLRALIVELRAFWVNDPGRFETRYGLASNYASLKDMANNPVMLPITLDAAKK